jgi:ribonuclease P protein component
LRATRDFARVERQGLRASGSFVSITVRPGPGRVGWVVSKKVDNRATERNRVKRRLREIVRREKPLFARRAEGNVDVVVAARDEQAVIGRLVERIAQLSYPQGQMRLWVIDDASSDRTPQVLAELQERHPFLQVLRREPDAGGGKSGALNLVLQQLQGRWMFVLDADADLQSDTLERLIPYAEAGGWSAVQLRKAEVNATANWLTRAQAMEMALDAVIQQGRLAVGGVAELRGNGQLLRRDALLSSGGFNEGTVTDDLDLSFRLLLDGQPIGILWDPPVQEEAVLSVGDRVVTGDGRGVAGGTDSRSGRIVEALSAQIGATLTGLPGPTGEVRLRFRTVPVAARAD